jgi:hypothetical protein
MQTFVAIIAFFVWLSGAEPNHQSASSFLNEAAQILPAVGIRPFET